MQKGMISPLPFRGLGCGLRKWRPGRVVEGTSLLRKHTGLNLYRGFESLGLRQKSESPRKRAFLFCGASEKPSSAVSAGFAFFCFNDGNE